MTGLLLTLLVGLVLAALLTWRHGPLERAWQRLFGPQKTTELRLVDGEPRMVHGVSPYREPAILPPAPVPVMQVTERDPSAKLADLLRGKKPDKEQAIPAYMRDWQCPDCGAGGMSLWSCCTHYRDAILRAAQVPGPGCLQLGAQHHIHVTCGKCAAMFSYQLDGHGKAVLLPRRER
jgi:hypothetical protein